MSIAPNSNPAKSLVNPQFCAALWTVARTHGHDALEYQCAMATAKDKDAADHIGAIMHGATWRACPKCNGTGKRGRGKCAWCEGAGSHPDFDPREIDAMRAEALLLCS